jgi:hypothetical protein
MSITSDAIMRFKGKEIMKSRTTRNIQIEKQTRRVLVKGFTTGETHRPSAKPASPKKAKKAVKK